MASFSTHDVLTALCQSIPKWNEALDEQTAQIIERQIELARVGEAERLPSYTMKNKGSTESLRPKDEEMSPLYSPDAENGAETDPFETPTSQPTCQRLNSAAAEARGQAVKTPPPSKTKGALTRQPSHPLQAKAPKIIYKKHRTESMASSESLAPKCRTRSMIMVWYDGAVQKAFEDMVILVSASRNAMRKGKNYAKTQAMNRAAEMELDEEDEEEDKDGADLGESSASKGALIPRSEACLDKQAPTVSNNGAAEVDDTNGIDPIETPLQHVSTRRLAATKVDPKSDNTGNTMSINMLKGFGNGRSGRASPDIFDIIDKGLEWVQAQCEHAASRVLRNPDCNTEIADIKGRLAEVKSTAEAEIERLTNATAEAEIGRLTKTNGASKRSSNSEPRGKQWKSPTKRGDLKTPTALAVDDMEVDDEGVEDLDIPKINFKRTRDMHA